MDQSSEEWERLLAEVEAKVKAVCAQLDPADVTEFMEDLVSNLELKLVALIELEQGP